MRILSRAGSPVRPRLLKAILVMKLITFLMLTALTQVSAAGFGQSVTLKEKNASVEKVLRSIATQSGYNFLYDRQDIPQEKITVNIHKASIEEALTLCLKGLPVTYKIFQQTIVLKRADRTETKEDKPIPPPIKVVGKITDAKGAPMQGAVVEVKGTNTRTATDAAGAFSITVPNESSVLVISYVGYSKQEVAVRGRTTVDISMAEQPSNLNEVVVIGYGEQSRRTVSTSISKIDGGNIGIQPVGTPGEALAAQAPGIEVQSDRGGTPGQAPSIRIRGGGSLGTPSDPLYVVDGYPLQDAAQFNLINPNDIASVELLKDAASAAIYGSRAANGVVIVTTKRGRAGKTVFSVNLYTGVQQISRKLDLLNRDEYIDHLRYQLRARAFPNPPGATLLSFNKPDTLPDTDWQDVIYRTAPTHNLQVSASGGSQSARFTLSAAYLSQDGIMIGTDYKRYNVRFNLDADLSPKLKVGVSVAPSYAQQNRQANAGQFNGSNGSENGGTRGVPNAAQSALILAPTLPVYLPNGDYGQGFLAERNPTGTAFYLTNLFNPLSVLELNENRLRSYRIFTNSFVEWTPLKGLRLKTSGGFNFNVDQQHAYIPATLASEAAPAASLSNPVVSSIFGRESQNIATDYLWENTLTYAKTLGDHSFNFLGLYSIQKYQFQATATAGRAGTFANAFINNPLASPDRIGELGYDQDSFLSYATRLTYDFRKKYIASAAIRSDASSKFGPNNRYATFPSVSAAWRVSEEMFWLPLRRTVSEFKLRASYGETGNANIGSFNYLNSIVSRNYSFNSTRAFGYVQSGFANPDLTWEKNKSTNLGMDLGFAGDKYSLTFDYYDRTVDGMLLQRDLPGLVGYATNYRTNIGSVRNRGIELNLTGRFSIGALKWTVSGNLSSNRSKVLDLGGPEAFPATQGVFGWNNVYQVRVGEPLGNMYGFVVTGLFKNADDLAKYPKNVAGDRVGNWRIEDYNGDGVISEADRQKIGKGLPDFIYGLTQNFTYKGFDATLILQGVQGVNTIQGNFRQFYNNIALNTTHAIYQNEWDPAAPERETRFPQSGAGSYNPGNQLTDRTLFDGSFLRIRNLTIGYTVNPKLLQRIKIQSLRVYATGQNLHTFTSYPGYSPEANVNTGSLIAPGLDQGTYPASRIMLFGVNFNF